MFSLNIEKIQNDLFEKYNLNEDTIYNEMGADELTTFIITYNEVLLFNNDLYLDLWNYSKCKSLFYEEPYNLIKNLLINKGIKSFYELRTNEEAFKEVLNIVLNV